MADQTNIEWTDATFNPWIGCTKVSPGCDNCYAAAQDKFRSWTPEGWGGPRKRTSPANWKQPLVWNRTKFFACPDCGWRGEFRPEGKDAYYPCPACRKAELEPARRRVFCASLADVFDNQVDPWWRVELFHLIQHTPNLDWLLLTKRIGNAGSMIARAVSSLTTGRRDTPPWPWSNVWLGATVVNQEEADRDIPKLLATPARVRFLSMEPLLGPVILSAAYMRHSQREGMWEAAQALDGLHWVIVGGESGPGARPMHPDWARSLRDQCAAAGVPFLFKQHGEWIGVPDLRRLDGGQGPGFGRFDHCAHDQEHDAVRVGKKAAGRLLDGVEHNGFPEVR